MPIESQIPVGLIASYAGFSLFPQGWLRCDGSAVSRDHFKALYAAIGNTYGHGDAETTFNLPDLRGRFPLGLSGRADRVTAPEASNLGGFGGEEVHKLTLNEMPSHDHRIVTDRTYSVAFPAAVPPDHIEFVGSSGSDGVYRMPQGQDAPHNNMSPYLTVNYIIFAGVITNIATLPPRE
jgi:microcystin-dependent protein